MALPASGNISLNQVNVELGLTATAQIGMNDAAVRTLFGKASGAVSMSDGYGKSNRVAIALTIPANTQNYEILFELDNTYSPGKTDVTLTINSGVVVGSVATIYPALDTGTGWTSGDTVKIINNGYIVGCGGIGGNAGNSTNGSPGNSGGTALQFQYATSITNNGVIGGGGGGGGGGVNGYATGGGGGGGAGNLVGSGGSGGFQNGQNGTLTSGGNGGNSNSNPGTGGTGGSAGVAGQNISATNTGVTAAGGGGGGLGANGGAGATAGYLQKVGGDGGFAGAATSGAATYATWVVTGTRYGAIN
jgi:hypothetical protein